MKNIFTLFVLSLLTQAVIAQTEPFLPDTNALEGIIVEKYYVSGPDDVASGLPEGSITYRVYADMKPGYTLRNFSAVATHPISIQVTNGGEFYNNPLGSTFGADVNPALFAVDATIGLDSWLAIGGASSQHIGILKSEDPDESSLLAGSPIGYLFNQDGYCLPSLQDQDGLVLADVPSITSLGINTDQLPIFGSQNSSQNFEVEDLTVAVLGGTTGSDEENRVLIGQFTTINGTLQFNINIQIGIPEELQCNVIPSCQKNSIFFTHSYLPQDTQDNQNPNLNYVTYQNETLSYVDDGAPCTLSTEDIARLDNAFNIAPNPTTGITQLHFSEFLESARLEVYSITGQLIKSQTLGNVTEGSVQQLDLSAFDGGVYLIKIQTADQYSIKKIVKQ